MIRFISGRYGLPALIVLSLAALSACGGGSDGEGGGALKFTNGQAAALVIGQPDFVSGLANQGGAVAADTLNSPYGNPYVKSGKMYLADHGNNRTLVFNSIPTGNGASADFAIGEPDLVSYAGGTSATLALGSKQAMVYNGKLLVTEADNNRISIYNTVPTAGSGTIDVVVGQADKTTSAAPCTQSGLYFPETAAMAGRKLVVADSGNNRVLIWDSIPTGDNQAADLVLGQADFTSCFANRGATADANTMNYPNGVWSDGKRLAVIDTYNHRLLIWNSMPTSNGQAADLVLGQPDFTSSSPNQGDWTSAYTMSYPWDGVYFNDSQLFIADCLNSRVLVWDSFPTANDQAADHVLGQPDYVSNSVSTSATGMSCPTGVFLYGKQLFVTDYGNSRYLIYDGM